VRESISLNLIAEDPVCRAGGSLASALASPVNRP